MPLPGAADQEGKPLTIRLMASNARVISWPKRIAGPVAGFSFFLGHRRAHHKSNKPKNQSQPKILRG